MTKKIKSIRFYGEKLVRVNYSSEQGFVDVLPNTSVVIGAFTTAQARRKLYSYLEPLQERELYMDTGEHFWINLKIIYVSQHGDNYEVPTGSFLGNMTDKLNAYGPGSYIDEFVGAGSKKTAIVTTTGQDIVSECLKVRGFSLNFTARRTVTFELMREMVSWPKKNPFSRKSGRGGTSVTRAISYTAKLIGKDYRVVINKVALFPDFTTLSFGY